MSSTESQPDVSGVALSGLSKTFPGTRALVDVDLDVVPGEVHALVGQNGSGKSTLIKVLAGFHGADHGSSATVRGRELDLGDATAAHRAGLRFVHQDLGLVLSESTVDNLALGVGYRTSRLGIKWRAQRQAARDLMRDLGHPIDVDVPVERLSAVERTAVAIARALQGSTDALALLVLDEPTATMPAGDIEMVYKLVRRVRDSGASVLYVSHHLDEVFALADRVTVLRDGRKIDTLNVAATSPRELADLMAGEVVDVGIRAERELGAPTLEIAGVSANVLSELELVVHAGEVVGLAGVDGSGRDEVAAAVFGGRHRTGTVRCSGQDVPVSRPDVAVGRGIGYVPADRSAAGLVMDMSVRENMTLPTLVEFWRRLRLRTREERADVAIWSARLGVKAAGPDAVMTSLSGGNQQKVVLGKWLKTNPTVLLLDEPTQGVDVAAKADVHRLIDEAAAQGTAVLVCSSDEVELVRLCSRVVVLDHGRVSAELTGSAITRAAITRASLGVADPAIHHMHENGA
ncbi:MAG: sugar ABC transporter ATP-binding protein [Marmoricola sp.]